MAVSLAVIAVCLVILVSRMQKMAQPNAKQATPARELKPGETETRHIPSFLRPGHKHIHDEPAPATAVQTAAVQSERTTENDAQPLIPVVAKEPQPVTPSADLDPVSASETNTGVITGRVFLQGKPPPETPIHLDEFCGGVHLKPATTHHYVVSPDGGLANVFVYIKSGLTQKELPTPETAVLDQVGCEFQPEVVGLMSLQGLVITNSDPHFHNVHAELGDHRLFSVAEQAQGYINKKFSNGDVKDGMSVIRLTCDVHPWMRAYACVVDHPYFAVTDSDGNYTITNVPPGKYELSAVHVRSASRIESSKNHHVAVLNGWTTKEDMVIRQQAGDDGSKQVKNR